MRLFASVLLSASAFVLFVWWVGGAVSERDSAQPASIYIDPRERIEIQEPIAPPPREELREECSPSMAEQLEERLAQLEADLEAERARAARLEADRERLEFVFGVRPMIRDATEAERMAALEERLARGEVPLEEVGPAMLALANWKKAKADEAKAPEK